MAVPPALEALALLVGVGAFLLSAAGTLHTLRWARAPVGPASEWRPFATVIVPCRGHHPGFEANVRAFLGQVYPVHEILFVVDEPADPCARALAAMDLPPHARVVLSEPEVVGKEWATGKVIAQLTGVAQASPHAEVLVFADADARPPPGWLACMAAPLAAPHVGAVTGYRWYTAATRASAWSALRDAWNAVGLDALTMPRFRFLWGGSMAVRLPDFQRSAVRVEWRWRVSEDVGLTRAIEGLGLDIAFAPGAMVATVEDATRAEVLEWVVRQSALTRAAMPRLFRFAEAVYAAAVVLLAVGVGLLLAHPTPTLVLAGALMLSPVASGWVRAWLRERLVRRALPLARAQPRRERALQLAWSGALPWFMLWALRRARRTDSIGWRGRQYRLLSEAP